MGSHQQATVGPQVVCVCMHVYAYMSMCGCVLCTSVHRHEDACVHMCVSTCTHVRVREGHMRVAAVWHYRERVET
jgi:hypothetical protein